MPGFCVGGIAQLGERLHGMQEVSGSIPLTSTNLKFVSIFVLHKSDLSCILLGLLYL